MTSQSVGIPSLLMEAARSAAVEDGLVNSRPGSTASRPGSTASRPGSTASRPNSSQQVQQQQQVPQSQQPLTQVTAPASNNTANYSAPGNTNESTQQSDLQSNLDAVKQAAMAMVASGNTTQTTSAVVTPYPSNTNGLNGMAMQALQSLQSRPPTSTVTNPTPPPAAPTGAASSTFSNSGLSSGQNPAVSQSTTNTTTTNQAITINAAPTPEPPAPPTARNMSTDTPAATTNNLKPQPIAPAPVTTSAVVAPPSAGSAAHMLAVAASGVPPMATTTTTSINNNNTSVSQVNPRPTTTNNHVRATQVAPAPPPPVAAPPSASPVPRSSGSSSSGKKKGPPLRRGKWTGEEEAYANRLIMEFKAGLLPLTDGTTLRTFLSKLLNCDPMRISKKFVGSNCIGKQVFRRRTADINRLTPDQIQQSRAELSELERRFLDRVAQNNRVKSSGVGSSNSGGQGSGSAAAKLKVEDHAASNSPPTPPWLRAPNGFKHGTGAQTAAAALSNGNMNSKAALAGRALLRESSLNRLNNHKADNGLSKLKNDNSANLLAFMEMKQRQSRQNLANYLDGGSRTPSAALLAAAAESKLNRGIDLGSNSNFSNSALTQLAQSASAAKLAELGASSNNSMNNLLRKTGLSRDQLNHLTGKRNSSNSLSNVLERQSSLEALMSLDLQSLQSIDNLANLIQTDGSNGMNSGLGGGSQVPRTGMKNWTPNPDESRSSSNNLAAIAASLGGNSSNNLASARRLASEGRMESLMRSLSGNNVGNKVNNNDNSSNATFSNLLQSVQNNLNSQDGNSMNSNNLLGLGSNAASVLSLANLLRVDSSTGLTALRMQDGLAQRNTSVDDFLSLVANGDIPHQDPHMLNVPLQSVLQQQQQNNNNSGRHAAAAYLAQQQLLHGNNGPSLSQRIASLGGLTGPSNSSTASLLNQYSSNSQNSLSNQAIAAALAQQHQARMNNVSNQHGNSDLKRKLERLDNADIDLRPNKK